MELSRAARSAESSAIRDLLRHADRDDVLSLAGGLPAAERFPVAAISEAASLVLARGDGLQYGLSEGDAGLRELVSPDGDPSSVVITTGSQQALDLIGRVLLDPGDPVVVGDPCYVGARQVLLANRASLVGIDVDQDGLDVEALAERLSGGLRPKLVSVVANFDNPSGVVLSAPRRRRLAELADHYDFLIIEDDPYGRLRYDGDDLDPIPGDRVLRLRSASKTLVPGLRVGWLSGPQFVVDAVVIAKQAVDLHTSTVSQAIVHELLQQPGWFEAHVAGLLPWYAGQRDALIEAVDTHLPTATYHRPDGGMFLWLQLPGSDTASVLTDAVESGVAFVPGSAFAVDRDLSDFLRLSFATVAADQLDEAVRRLAQVVPSA
ncbi:MAG: PLP-dependent aminotransferase family protein [Actinomycetota bacterium]